MPSMRSIGLHAFADDALDLVDQPHAQRRQRALRRQHVVRLVHQARCPRPRSRRAAWTASDADLVGIGIGLGLRRTVGRGRRPPIFSACGLTVRAQPSRSASCGRAISSIGFLRSAISISRAVNTFSSADTASARAVLGLGLRLGLRLATAAAMAMARCCSASSSAWRRSISAAGCRARA